MTNRTRVAAFAAWAIAAAGCGTAPDERLSEGAPEDVFAQQNVRVLDPSGREMQYAETTFVAGLSGYCQRRLEAEPAGANGCGVPENACSIALCDAEVALCIANTLLEIRGLHGEIRIDLPDPVPPDGGAAALVSYSIPQQSTGTNALLARSAFNSAMDALEDASKGLSDIVSGACSPTSSAMTYAGGLLTLRGGLAQAFAEAYQVAEDAAGATSQDFIAASQSDAPVIWDGVETDDDWERAMPATVMIGWTDASFPGELSTLCAAEAPAGGAAIALRLFREAGFPPADLQGAAATETLVVGGAQTSLRGRLAALWNRPELVATCPGLSQTMCERVPGCSWSAPSCSGTRSGALTSAQVYDVFGARLDDFEQAREYLRTELTAFARDVSVEVPPAELSGPVRYAAVATTPIPHPSIYYTSLVRERVYPGPGSYEPRRISSFAAARVWGWSGIVDFAAKKVSSLLRRLPAAALADANVERALATLATDLEDDYVGVVGINPGADSSQTEVEVYLPSEPTAFADYVIVNNPSDLSCVTRGEVESVGCEWPDGAIVATGQATDEISPGPTGITVDALPVRVTFPDVPASNWTRLYLVRLRPGGTPNTPGEYEPLIGFPGPTTWDGYDTGLDGNSWPIIPTAEEAVGGFFSPSSSSCDRARLHCTGLREDGRIALEDDLSADGDPRESSWRHYLELARQAAAEADLLGEQVLEGGEAIDQRAELALETVQQICGAEIDIDPFATIPVSELRSTTTCPSGTGCPSGYRCQSGACVRDLIDLVADQGGPGYSRLAECVGPSQIAQFVALGSRPLCLWRERANPNAVCTGGGSRACPFEPHPGGATPTIENQCPVPDALVHEAILIDADHTLGFFEPDDGASTRTGGTPPCAQIRRMRATTDVPERLRLMNEIVRSGYFASPNALQSMGASVVWRAQPLDYSTLSVGRATQITTGDFVSGTNTAWPCDARGSGVATPEGCDGGIGVLCDRAANCSTGTSRAVYNDRLARAAVLARLLTANPLSGFRLPSYPRYDAELAGGFSFHGYSDILDARGQVLRVASGVGANLWDFAAPFVPQAFADGGYRVYAYCNGGTPTALWHTVGATVRPLGDQVACNDPVAFYDVAGELPGPQAPVARFWGRTLAAALLSSVTNPSQPAALLPVALVPGNDVPLGHRRTTCSRFPDECTHCYSNSALTRAQVEWCFEAMLGDPAADAPGGNPVYVSEEEWVELHHTFATSAAGNGAFIARDGFTGANFLDAVELLCEAGSAASAGCDFENPPSIRDAGDLPLASAFMSCIANDMERRAALTVFANMPVRAMDALRLQSSVGSFPEVGGEYGAALSRLRGSLVELSSVPGMIAEEVRQMSNDVARVQEALAQSELSRESAEIEFLGALETNLFNCASAVTEVASVGKFGAAAQATIACANSFSQIRYAGRIREIQEESTDGQDRSVMIDLRSAFSERSEALRALAVRLAAAIELIDASLAEMETLRQRANGALARALLLTTEGAGAAYHTNTFMRARYDARRVRYERARDRALQLAFLAKRAIEQRLGARLSSMREDLGVIDAPANWEDDLCTMDAIDYRRLRDATSLPRGTLDASIALSNGYIGDYVDRLELVFTAYANRYPFTPGDATTVFSLRDDIHRVRAQCPPDVPGPNLLYHTDSMSVVADGGSGGWQSVGCVAGDEGTCVEVSRIENAAAIDSGVSGFGQPTPFRVTFGPYGGGTCSGGICTPICTTTSCPCVAPTCRTTESTEWQQVVTLPQGRYRLSWYGRSVGAPSNVSPLEAVRTPTGAIEGDVRRTQVSSRGLAGGWSRYWGLFEVRGETATLAVSVGAIASDGSVALVGAIDLAGLMLEDVSHAFDRGRADEGDPVPEPPPFVGTGATLASTVPICEDTSGDVFRRQGWRRSCEWLCPDGFSRGCTLDASTQHCFWETQFTISQDAIEQSAIFRNSSLAIGNFNYRIDGIALNLVGSGVRSCATSPVPSSCYGSGVVPFSLTHVGPYRVRNHWGQMYDAPLFTARVEHGQALAAERYLSVPLSSADRALVDSVTHHELRGRPLDGTYVLRIWESDGVDFERLEDVQVMLSYYYWTRGS